MATSVDSTPQPRTGQHGERTIGQLISDASQDVSQIVRSEMELAKTEIKQDLTHAGKGAGMFAGAGLFGLYGLGLLFLGLAGVIAIWLPWWAGLLIMAGVLFLVAAILALVGKGQVSKVKGKPEEAIGQGQLTVETLKVSAQPPYRADGSVPDHTEGATSAQALRGG